MKVENIKALNIEWSQFCSYVELSATVDDIKMKYRIDFKLQNGVISFYQAAYKTNRQKQYNFINGATVRGMEEKRQHIAEQLKFYIPDEIINYSLNYVLLEGITIQPYRGEI